MPFLPLDAPATAGAVQLVVTLGPASIPLAGELAASGATAFRLNASHLGSAELSAAMAQIRRACPGAPVVIDLQGAKMRIDVAAPLRVAAGQVVRFSESDAGDVRVPHPELFTQVAAGDTLSVDDARVRFEVVRVAAGALEAVALTGGSLLPRRGLNVEQHPLKALGLTARDAEACGVAARHQASGLAFSFMADGSEAAWLREASPGCHVIGKVERREAVAHLDEIASRVDAVWICRGDLGAQVGMATLARLVSTLDASRWPVPMLMAGQVLEHLTAHADPTRSEVCHLYDLVARGFAGFVLSDETTIGHDPVHAVSTAAGLLSSFRS